jgi:predicted DsbA family dithiol-disulfide isomerase
MFVHSSRGILLEFRFWSCLLLFLVLGAVSASAQSPETVLATINGRDITQKQVDDSVKPQIYPLQQQLYAIRKAALENLVTSRILETEATARGISIDELRKQLTLGEITVTRSQIEDAYKQNASFFAAMSPDEAKERLRLDLENQARMKHYRTGLEALRQKWTVRLNLVAPPFVSELDDGHAPARGSTKPVVTIVEFSDFECPFCREVQLALNQVVQSYGNEVRLIFKHLPLEGHRNSLPAARAAYCAGEQDRFWPYHDALFSSGKLSPVVLEEIAAEIGLGIPKFRACLDSEHSRTAIVKDIETARLFRIDSTPSFLVNGKLVKGALSFADFQKIIERELNQRAIEKQSSAN